MSTNINGIGVGVDHLTDAAKAVQPAHATDSTAADGAAGADEASVSVDLQSVAGDPPPEVSAAVDRASQEYDRLDAAGEHIEFNQDAETGALTAQLHSADGSSRALSPSEVLDLADGSEPR